MFDFSTNAQQRAQSTCAKNASPTQVNVYQLIKRAFNLIAVRQQKLPRLSDRLARDIGLSPHDLEWQRHKFPSQHQHHPRL